MSHQLKHTGAASHGSAGAVTPATRAPGKTTRTQALPARQPVHHEMTGYPLLDQGLACDDVEPGTPGCFLADRPAQHLFDMIQTSAHAYCDTMLTALGNVRIDLLTKKSHSWSGWHELAFMLITTAAIGPLAGAMAGVAAKAAVRLAVRGATKAAWTAAGVDAGRIAGSLTMMSKGLRSSLAHRAPVPPTNQVEFVSYLQSLVQPAAGNILQGVAEQQLNHTEMLELEARLNDPELVGLDRIEQRIRTLLAQFDENRIGSIGNAILGGWEVAQPVRVRLRKKEFMVLCESHGVHNSALALNGANIDLDKGVPRMTQESLVFVRVIEDSFRDLVAAEYKAKRKEEPTFIDFNDHAQRRQHRWFPDFYREVERRRLGDYVEQMHNIGSPSVAHDPDAEPLEAS